MMDGVTQGVWRRRELSRGRLRHCLRVLLHRPPALQLTINQLTVHVLIFLDTPGASAGIEHGSANIQNDVRATELSGTVCLSCIDRWYATRRAIFVC